MEKKKSIRDEESKPRTVPIGREKIDPHTHETFSQTTQGRNATSSVIQNLPVQPSGLCALYQPREDFKRSKGGKKQLKD